MCAKKRRVGALETDWAGQLLQLRHQPNLLDTVCDGKPLQVAILFSGGPRPKNGLPPDLLETRRVLNLDGRADD